MSSSIVLDVALLAELVSSFPPVTLAIVIEDIDLTGAD